MFARVVTISVSRRTRFPSYETLAFRQRISTATTTSFPVTLPQPEVLYSDNHLLVVNKPPGWHSVPNSFPSPKCLVTHLQQRQLGGGSRSDFLLPLHRIDQPCSGVLLLGKTRKAASRITSVWKKKWVEKSYLCVVSTDNLMYLEQASSELSQNDDNQWSSLTGHLRKSSKGQRSVQMVESTTDPDHRDSSSTKVSLQWKFVAGGGKSVDRYTMILVRTSQGTRHMIRALLAKVGGCPIVGDLRYDSSAEILPDQSVALHASQVILPDSLQLGSLVTRTFHAPPPSSWNKTFGPVPSLDDLLGAA